MSKLEHNFQQAVTLHQSGRWQQAIPLYRQCLLAMPNHAECHHLLGLALAQGGDLAAAEPSLQQAVALQPRNGAFLNNLAEVQRKAGRLVQAIANFNTLVALQPDFATAHYNLALACKAGGEWLQAEHHLRQAITLQPDYTKAHYNLGNLYLELGRFQEAVPCFEQALLLQPGYAEALINLGSAQQQIKQYEAAIESYRKALALDAGSRSAQLNLAICQQQVGAYRQAIEGFAGLAEKGGTEQWYALRAAGVLPEVADGGAHIETIFQTLWQCLDGVDERGAPLDLSSLHSSGLEPPSQLIYLGRNELPLKRRYAERFTDVLPAFIPASNQEKPRIGFVVTSGHEGVFCKCMGGIVERLPTRDYDVYVVCQQSNLSYLQQQITAPQVRFLALPRSLEQAHEVLMQHPFDLLHYWEIGTDSSNYFLPLLRPARVQCATWGWPVSSGMSQVDYFISSELLETTESDHHYSEQLIRLPSLPSYYLRPCCARALADVPELPPGKIRYLCMQNLRKVHPDIDPLLAAILRQVPDATVTFIEDSRPLLGCQLRERWQKTLPDVISRIHFVPQQSPQDYLAMVAAADVILDTPHYCGGANTTYDAFAMGKVIVTLPGELHRSRYCSAAYRHIGISEAIADTAEAYIEIAVKLGRDREYRRELEQKILLQGEGLFEDQKAVSELNDFLLEAIMSVRD